MAMDIEFLIISVIQGMALQILASVAAPILGDLKFEFWPYLFSAFVLILVFWSQSVIHAWSFIDWPIDLPHAFLYFLASFIEVIAFIYITDPLRWYLFGLVFLVVMAVLYVYDLSVIKRRKNYFKKNQAYMRLFHHTYTRQIKELKVLVTSALIFNITASVLIFTMKSLFLESRYHVIIGTTQAIFSCGLLYVSIKGFKKRTKLITEAFIAE